MEQQSERPSRRPHLEHCAVLMGLTFALYQIGCLTVSSMWSADSALTIWKCSSLNLTLLVRTVIPSGLCVLLPVVAVMLAPTPQAPGSTSAAHAEALITASRHDMP